MNQPVVALKEESFIERVSGTDVRRLAECPLQLWYGKRSPAETAAPSLALAVGSIEHEVRARLTRRERARFLGMDAAEFEWGEAQRIALEQEVDEYFAAHAYASAYGDIAGRAQADLIERLQAEQAERAERYRALSRQGVDDTEITDQLFPVSVETFVEDLDENLVGVIDEIWVEAGALVPVELKTTPASARLRPGHELQVLLYAYLLRRSFGRTPPHARVRYTRAAVDDIVAFDEQREADLKTAIARVREICEQDEPPEGNPGEEICDYCPFQVSCPVAVVPDEAAYWGKLR